jgi:hypothetical protein
MSGWGALAVVGGVTLVLLIGAEILLGFGHSLGDWLAARIRREQVVLWAPFATWRADWKRMFPQYVQHLLLTDRRLRVRASGRFLEADVDVQSVRAVRCVPRPEEPRPAALVVYTEDPSGALHECVRFENDLLWHVWEIAVLLHRAGLLVNCTGPGGRTECPPAQGLGSSGTRRDGGAARGQ